MSSDQSKWASRNWPKWVEKRLIDSKYNQNDPIWAQNGPKWAKMIKILNELKRDKMSSNEPQWAHT